ncbi:MAG TPA: ATP-binding protein [Anaerolineaceae bacterium]|nr:ATP-binding protein [Anaerolineaceae bacterium]
MHEQEWQAVQEFSYPSEQGNERIAAMDVAEVARQYLPEARLEQLKTAVAEATLNAIEHGNQNQPELTVRVQVLLSELDLGVRITDQGGDKPIPENTRPDLDRKLAGLESPRGWGLYLIRNMVDEMNITSDTDHHTLELVFHR